jgi:excisionase family DNA binding protein
MNSTTSSSSSSVRVSESAPNDWYSPKEAAERVHIATRSIYRAIRRGELQASKVNGRDLRICTAWLNAWMERKAVQR